MDIQNDRIEESFGKANVQSMSFDFAIMIVELYKDLSGNKKEYVMSKQLLRSGTAVGALVRESQNAESKADFFTSLQSHRKNAMKRFIGWNYFIEPTFYRRKFLYNTTGSLHPF